MSSDHGIIVARNTVTGEIQLPLGDTTLYDTSGFGLDDMEDGVGSVKSILDGCREQFSEEWTLSLYVIRGPSYCGTKKT